MSVNSPGDCRRCGPLGGGRKFRAFWRRTGGGVRQGFFSRDLEIRGAGERPATAATPEIRVGSEGCATASLDEGSSVADFFPSGHRGEGGSKSGGLSGRTGSGLRRQNLEIKSKKPTPTRTPGVVETLGRGATDRSGATQIFPRNTRIFFSGTASPGGTTEWHRAPRLANRLRHPRGPEIRREIPGGGYLPPTRSVR